MILSSAILLRRDRVSNVVLLVLLLLHLLMLLLLLLLVIHPHGMKGRVEGLLAWGQSKGIAFPQIVHHRQRGRFPRRHRIGGRNHQVREFSLTLIKKSLQVLPFFVLMRPSTQVGFKTRD